MLLKVRSVTDGVVYDVLEVAPGDGSLANGVSSLACFLRLILEAGLGLLQSELLAHVLCQVALG